MTEPFRRVPVLPAYLALVAPVAFLVTVLLKYGLGIPGPFDRLDSFWTSAFGEAVVLLGPVVALALTALAVLRVVVRREGNGLVGTVSMRLSVRHVVALVLSLGILSVFGLYFLTENF